MKRYSRNIAMLPAGPDDAAHRDGKMTAGTVYVVVPVFNRKSLTERFLGCMRDQTFRRFKVIVVDDGSTDGTSALIADKFPEVQLLGGDGNLWWTGAINVGIRHAMTQALETDAILVINDDLDIDADYLETLARVWKLMPRTLIGSVAVDIQRPELIFDGGRRLNPWTAKFTMMNAGKPLAAFSREHHVDVSFLTGWGALIPLQVFRDVGLFDDKHFQQCGDTELSLRAKHAGYRLVVSYAARVRVHLNESDGVNISASYALTDLYKYLFDVKSNCRLKYRWFFGLSATTNVVAFASFLLCDVMRLTSHFVARVRFSRQ